MKYVGRSVKVQISISALVEQARSRHRAKCIASRLGAPGDACSVGLLLQPVAQ